MVTGPTWHAPRGAHGPGVDGEWVGVFLQGRSHRVETRQSWAPLEERPILWVLLQLFVFGSEADHHGNHI